MDEKAFKKMFGQIADASGFDRAFGCWIRQSSECLFVLNLQKSNYGRYYELNVKIFIDGLFGRQNQIDKNLLKNAVGNVSTRQPNEFAPALALDNLMDDQQRAVELLRLFDEFLVPLADKAMTRSGVIELGRSGQLFLLPAVRDALEVS
jgi:hypothetical protein